MDRSQRAAVRELRKLGYEEVGHTGRGHVKLQHPLVVEHHLVVGNRIPSGHSYDNLMAEGRREVQKAHARWSVIHERIETGEDRATVIRDVAEQEGLTYESLRAGFKRWEQAHGLAKRVRPVPEKSRRQYERVAAWIREGATVAEAAQRLAAETGRSINGIEVTFYTWLRNERMEGRDPAPGIGQSNGTPVEHREPEPEPLTNTEVEAMLAAQHTPPRTSPNGMTELLSASDQRDVVKAMRDLLLPDLEAERELAIDALRSARHALEQSMAALNEITAALEQLTGQGVEPVK